MTRSATHDQGLTDHSERPHSILRFWKAVELFSPQKIPAVNPNSRTTPTFRVGGRTPVPWDGSKWFQEAEPGKEWRFTAYCGVYKQTRVRAILERRFGRNPADFDRRTDGESCLFAVQITAEGRALLDTFTLASCAWATGRLEDPGPKSAGWLDGFETAAKEFTLSFAERFAVLENDEVGRKLNSQPGVYVSRPVQSDDLPSEVQYAATRLNVLTLLDPKEVRISARQIPKERAFDAESDDFLNSFLLSDLARLAHEATSSDLGRALSLYLTPERNLDDKRRCDLRSSFDQLWQNTSPSLFPLGRWPAASQQSLYFSQQLAVNSALEELKNDSVVFGVNGPPGTGKTTLLRELIATAVVQRAQALSELNHPKDAFVEPPIEWQSSKYKGKVYPWRESLTGCGVVVASSNNRAVENVTFEIPAAEAISESYSSEIDYYKDFASRILQQRDTHSKQKETDAWGLISARLGKKKNRQSFVSSFWFADKTVDEPRSRAEQGFLRYLTTVTAKPGAWQKAVERFKGAVERESAIRRDRASVWSSIRVLNVLAKQVEELQSALRGAEASMAQIHEDLLTATDREQEGQKTLDDAVKARKEHLGFKPTLIDALFTLGRVYREWRKHDLPLAAHVELQRAKHESLRLNCERLTNNLNSAKMRVEKLTADFNRAETNLVEQRFAQSSARERLGSAYPKFEHWRSDPQARELSSPWADESWNEARTRVFIEALHLHRTFIECVPKQMKTNVGAAMDILLGKVSPQVQPQGLLAAWESFFFVIPVVSSTFASFDRLFAHLGRESIGWLLIDEAGQAVPQAAAGALWRSRKAIVVGDPLQLEPIVTLPFTAQQALRCYFQVEDTWLPSKNSVQTLSDRVSRLGTLLRNEENDEPTWVGSPLRVHRRCENPMFAISNEIAYSGQMVYATEEVGSSLPKTKWIDIKGPESDDHWIPAEGLALQILLTELFASGLTGSEILLISPFRAVARKLKEIGQKWGISGAGTIHVSQGKESEVVVLVLGGDPRKPGAKDWASEKPNLLNVAVSRAKRRLFIIGDREQWKQYPFFGDAAFLIAQHEAMDVKPALLDGTPSALTRSAEA
jgi:AAA domain